MNELLYYFQSLDSESQVIIMIIAGLAVLLILAIIYVFWRRVKGKGLQETFDRTTKHDIEIEALNERNKLLRKRLSKLEIEGKVEPTPEEQTLENSQKTIRLQGSQIDRLKGTVSHYRQKSIRTEELVGSKTDELSAVYKGERDYSQDLQLIRNAEVAMSKDIMTPYATRKIPSITYPQAGVTVIALCIVAYLYLNKPLQEKILEVLGTQRFQLYFVIGLVVLGVIIYYLRYRRKK